MNYDDCVKSYQQFKTAQVYNMPRADMIEELLPTYLQVYKNLSVEDMLQEMKGAPLDQADVTDSRA